MKRNIAFHAGIRRGSAHTCNSGKINLTTKKNDCSAAPERISLDLSSDCHQRCRYCCFFGRKEGFPRRELTTEEWREVIREAGRIGVMEITFGGGEPLLRDDFPALVREAAANRMRFRLLTNGILMTDAIAAGLAATRRCNQVKISLDGPEDIHDSTRGPGTCAAAAKGIDCVRKHGLPLLVTAAIHRRNYRELPRILSHLIDEQRYAQVALSLVSDAGEAEELSMDTAAINEAVRLLLPLLKRYRENLAPAGLAGMVRHWHRISRKEPRRVPFGSCGSFREALQIRADGVFVPCPSLCGIELGSCDRETLAEVWHSSGKLQKLRGFNLDPGSFARCRSCPYAAFCRGWCPAMPEGGNSCLKRYIEQCGALPDELF